jgi:hypothetical protein
VIDGHIPVKVPAAIAELKALDSEFGAHVEEFLSRVPVLQRGHYGTWGYTGPSMDWWQIPAIFSEKSPWHDSPLF